MKKKLFIRKALSALLALVMLVTVMPLSAITVSASTNSYTYNAEAAIAFAESHCSSEKQLAKGACAEDWLCAEFVANCLKAGGFTISGYTATVNAKAQGEYMQQYETKMPGNITGKAIHDYDFVLPLKKGDIVYIVYDDTVIASGHVLLYSGEKDSNGNYLFYAHNNRKIKETYALTGEYLEAATEMYAIILDSTSNASTKATAATEIDRIKTQIKNTYSKALSMFGKSSFDGWCGSYVQYQLRALGITSSTDSDIKGNGNKMYTNAKTGTTSKGYTKTKYAGNSCLTDLINANGGGNVYNVYVSWTHQYGYTNSNPGAGHVTFIHAILDGTVYYSESYASSSAKEGAPQSCSVSTFMSKYNKSYGNAIGAVHFTSGSSVLQPTNSTNPDSYPVCERDLVYNSTVETGNDVKWVQCILKHLGYSINIDGSYGPSSRDTIKKFQSDYGLTVDGQTGPKTRAKLKEVWASKGHTWNSGTIVTAATHTTTGVKTYKCNYCEATKNETTTKLSDHTYGTWQNHSSTQHKKTCACGDVQYANHTWNSGTITKAATHTEEGIKTYTCTGCNATKTEAIAKLSGHTYGAWLNYDETKHKRVCACGSYELSDHNWDNGIITTPATDSTEGIKTYTCSACSATKTEKLPVLAANHEWDDGVITHTPLCIGEGIKTYTCVKCGETKEVIINFTTHTFKGWQNYNDTQHIRECACGEAQEIGDHTWDTVLVAKNPTCSEMGVETHYCSTCGTSKTEQLPMLPHEWDAGVISTPASTTQEGVKTFECVNCDASKTEKIPMLDVSENSPLITVSDYEAVAGGTVTITIALKNNPGIASLILKIAYDRTLLTLTNVQYNTALGGQTIIPVDLNSPVTLYWINAFADMSEDTVFATLTFKVNDDAVAGNSSDIVISYNANDVYNINEENIEFTTQKGTITVSDYLPGDINGDGELNNKDVTRLMQYFADWDVEVNEAAVDVNGDGTRNNKDVSRLMQYLAGWNVVIY